MIKSYQNFSLSGHNTFAMDVKCGSFVEYDMASDIPLVLSSVPGDTPVIHIGGGSNLLFTSDYPGVVLHSAIKGMNEVGMEGSDIFVEAGAGVVMDELIAATCAKGLWGLENLSGIPGEVGASAVQNVGAYGAEAADVIKTVNAYDTLKGEFVEIPAGECGYGYRDSIFKHPDNKGRYIIHSVTYRLSTTAKPNISYPALRDRFTTSPSDPMRVREAVIAIRDTKLPDPASVPSAGSFFKNPVVSPGQFEEVKRGAQGKEVPHYEVAGGVKIPAAWLIDQCGWKGYREGNVGVWHLQPLVIVNPDRKARPDEVVALEEKIIDSVRDRFGVILSPEVEHI